MNNCGVKAGQTMTNKELKKLILELAVDLEKASEKARQIAGCLLEDDEMESSNIESNDKITLADLRKIVAPAFKTNRTAVLKILEEFQAKSLAEISEERYPEFLEAVKGNFELSLR